MNNLLLALTLTVLMEFPVIYLFIREKPGRTLLCTLLINLFTLPLATFSYIYLLPNLVIIEALVVVWELLLIKLIFQVKFSTAFIISLAANTVSALMGVFIFMFIF